MRKNIRKNTKLFLMLAFLLTATVAVADSESPKNMVWLEGGEFTMGSDKGFDHEKPTHKVKLNGFWMDQYLVTNKDFSGFVKATGYVTYSEKPLSPEDYPDMPKEKLLPSSIVFKQPKGNVNLRDYQNWWEYVPGADWRHPDGPASHIKKKGNHPVVQVTYDDANAYCQWAGKELPTEAQFEYAARGGIEGALYVWGNEPKHLNEKVLNIWQGDFPVENKLKDGYYLTSPVGSFKPNGYGLYDMAGNVWKWIADWYSPDYYQKSPYENPKGPTREESSDPNDPGIPKRVTRGGSFLCSDNYCTGYRPSARMASEPNSSSNHIGFRCVKNP